MKRILLVIALVLYTGVHAQSITQNATTINNYFSGKKTKIGKTGDDHGMGIGYSRLGTYNMGSVDLFIGNVTASIVGGISQNNGDDRDIKMGGSVGLAIIPRLYVYGGALHKQSSVNGVPVRIDEENLTPMFGLTALISTGNVHLSPRVFYSDEIGFGLSLIF